MVRTRHNKEACNCDLCGRDMSSTTEELVLNSKIWADICNRFNNKNKPKDTLLCPKCIEKLLGRSPTIKDLTSNISGTIFPINYWYLKKNGIDTNEFERRHREWNSTQPRYKAIYKNGRILSLKED